MINVNIKPGKIEVTGHAGYAEKGKDIVCAGASTLAQAAALAIASYDDTAQLEAVDGHLLITFERQDDYTNGIMDALEIGASCLEAQYGDFIKVTCTR